MMENTLDLTKQKRNKCIKNLKTVTKTDDLNSITLKLQNKITLIAFNFYKKRSTLDISAQP